MCPWSQYWRLLELNMTTPSRPSWRLKSMYFLVRSSSERVPPSDVSLKFFNPPPKITWTMRSNQHTWSNLKTTQHFHMSYTFKKKRVPRNITLDFKENCTIGPTLSPPWMSCKLKCHVLWLANHHSLRVWDKTKDLEKTSIVHCT